MRIKMIEKTCRCGKSKKNFKLDIGPFFINDCCTEEGYNHLGQKVIATVTGSVTEKLLPGETAEEAESRILNKIMVEPKFSKKDKNKKS